MNQAFLEALAVASSDPGLTQDQLQAIVNEWPNENLEAAYMLADVKGWDLKPPQQENT